MIIIITAIFGTITATARTINFKIGNNDSNSGNI